MWAPTPLTPRVNKDVQSWRCEAFHIACLAIIDQTCKNLVAIGKKWEGLEREEEAQNQEEGEGKLGTEDERKGREQNLKGGEGGK